MDERKNSPVSRPLPAGWLVSLFGCFSLCCLTVCTRKPTAPNYPPAVVLSVSPASGTIDTLFILDPTCSTDQEDATDRLRCRWDFEGDRKWDTGWVPLLIRQYRYAVSGVKSVILQVIDTGGEHNQASSCITVAGPPHAEMRVTPDRGTVNTTFLFSAYRSSDNLFGRNELEYRWDFEGDSAWNTDWSGEDQVEHRYGEGGDYRVLLEVRNPAGLVAQDSLQLHVHPSDSGPVALLTVEPCSGSVRTIFAFDATGSSDPDDPPAELEFRFDPNGDGDWETDWRSNGIFTCRYSEKGELMARVEVRDPWGLSDTTSVGVHIVNLPPAAVLLVNPVAGAPSVPRALNAALSDDPDDSDADLLYRWDVDGDGVWDTDRYHSEVLEYTYSDYGLYYPKVEVMDPEGATAVDSSRVHVTREVLWKVNLKVGLIGLPALSPDESRIVVNTDGKLVYCVGRGGSVLWNFLANGWLVGSPAVDEEGTAYVGTGSGYLQAITAGGSARWSRYVGYEICTSPAIADDGTIYVGAARKGLLALDPENGNVKWDCSGLGDFAGSPTIGVDGTIYIATTDLGLHAVSPAGTKIWGLEDLAPLGSAPVPASDGTVYVCGKNGTLAAVGSAGNLLWDVQLQAIGVPPTIGGDGTLYLPCGDDDATWLSAVDPGGVELWRIDGGLLSVPSVAPDGTLLFSVVEELASDYLGVMLREYNRTAGYLAEWFTGYGLFGSPAVDSEGRVYLCTGKGYVMAVESQTPGLSGTGWPRERGDNQNTGRIRY